MATKQTDGGATTGYEAELWAMTNMLRSPKDAGDYLHVVLGLIFLEDMSNAFEERYAAVLVEWREDVAEDRDKCIGNIFWVPRRGTMGSAEVVRPARPRQVAPQPVGREATSRRHE